MTDGLKVIVIIVVGMIAIALTGFGISKYLGPEAEQVRYDNFKQSQTYIDGSIQDLEDLRVRYETAGTQGAKDAIKDTIRRRVVAVDRSKLTPELQKFIDELSL